LEEFSNAEDYSYASIYHCLYAFIQLGEMEQRRMDELAQGLSRHDDIGFEPGFSTPSARCSIHWATAPYLCIWYNYM